MEPTADGFRAVASTLMEIDLLAKQRDAMNIEIRIRRNQFGRYVMTAVRWVRLCFVPSVLITPAAPAGVAQETRAEYVRVKQ